MTVRISCCCNSVEIFTNKSEYNLVVSVNFIGNEAGGNRNRPKYRIEIGMGRDKCGNN